MNAILIGIAIGGYTFNVGAAFYQWWHTRRAHAFLAGIALVVLLIKNIFVLFYIFQGVYTPYAVTISSALSPLTFLAVSIVPKRSLWYLHK